MMGKWILLLAGVVALFIMAGGALPATSEAGSKDWCEKNNPKGHPKCEADGELPAGQLGLTEMSGPEYGVYWDSSFADFGYAVGAERTMTVNWWGSAQYPAADWFTLEGITPQPKNNDPADGNLMSAIRLDTPEDPEPCRTDVDTDGGLGLAEGCVLVTLDFTALHCALNQGVEIGNAHFKLNLYVPAENAVIGFGVNVHVEDPIEEGGGCIYEE